MRASLTATAVVVLVACLLADGIASADAKKSMKTAVKKAAPAPEGEQPDKKVNIPMKGEMPQWARDGGEREFDVHFGTLTEEEKSDLNTPRHWRCSACQGAAHMITEYIKKASLFDPLNAVNLTEPRPLMEHEVIDAVDALCEDSEAWAHYGSIGLKSGINFLWGPGVEPPPPGQQVENKHHTTTHGEIMKFRMKQTCRELSGQLDEGEWYRTHVLQDVPARKAVCDKSGQACHKYPTNKFIEDFTPGPEKAGGLFESRSKKQKKPAAAAAAKPKKVAGKKGKGKGKKGSAQEEEL